MPDAERLALLGAGVYFLTGLLTGIWKYRGIMSSPTGEAHPYVDIVHRAALMYAFASLVVWKFAELSTLGGAAELWAVLALEGYLGLSGALGKGSLDGRTRERIALAVAEFNGCGYCTSAHAFIGKNIAGLS